MGTGIGIVFRHNGRGGLIQINGDRWIMDLLAAALMDGDSRNPFQSVGLFEDIIFSNPDEELWGDLKIRISEIFDRFEDSGLAKLDSRPDNLQPFQTSEGQYGMRVYFINLEKNSPTSAQLVITVNGFVAVV